MTNPRPNLKRDLAALAVELGSISLASAMARYPEKSKPQVLAALGNASHDELIHRIGSEAGKGNGRKPGIYAPGPGPKRPGAKPRPVRKSAPRQAGRRIASVWELGGGEA